MLNYLIVLLLLVIPLYPKFPLLAISGTFVAVRLEDIVIALVVTVWFFTRLRQKTMSKLTPLHWSLIIFLGIGFMSTFSAVFLTKTVTLKIALLHTLRRVEYISLFFVGFDALRHRSQLSFIVKTILITSLIVALYGLGQQFLNFPVVTTTNTEFSKGLALSLGPGARINSTFAGHYDLAAYSLFPLLLIIGLIFIPGRSKWAMLLIGGLAYWTMLLSASRVTFAAFFITAGAFLLLIRRYFWIPALIILAFVSVLLSPQLAGRYKELIINHLQFSYIPTVRAVAVDEQEADALKPSARPEDRSLNIRLKAEWPRALRAFYKNPFLGTGFSSVGLATDNDFLRSLAETGLLGTVAFGLILLQFFRSTIPILRSRPTDLSSAFVITTTCFLIGLLLNAIFIDVFEASKIATFFWTVAGITHKLAQPDIS